MEIDEEFLKKLIITCREYTGECNKGCVTADKCEKFSRWLKIKK